MLQGTVAMVTRKRCYVVKEVLQPNRSSPLFMGGSAAL